MRYIYLLLVGAMLVSCSSEPQNQDNLALPDGTLPSMNSSNTAAPSGLIVNPAHGQPGHDCSVPVGAALKPATVAAPVSTGEVRLNPAHGQPGHDCAVPVGSPLNAGANTITTTPTPAPAPVAAPVATTEVIQEANGG